MAKITSASIQSKPVEFVEGTCPTTVKPRTHPLAAEPSMKMRPPDADCCAQAEKPALARLMEALERGQAARTVLLGDDERLAVRGLQLLTMKPLIYAMNVAEGDLGNSGADNPHVAAMHKQAEKDNCSSVLVSAQVGGRGHSSKPGC